MRAAIVPVAEKDVEELDVGPQMLLNVDHGDETKEEVLKARITELTGGLKEVMVLFREREESFDSLAGINLQLDKKVMNEYLSLEQE